MRAIEMLHFLKRDLARSCCRRYRGVGKLATFTQSEQARRKADFAHRNSNTIAQAGRELEKSDRVSDCSGGPSHLDAIDFVSRTKPDGGAQGGHPPEIVDGEKNAPRQGKAANRIPGKLAKRLDLEIAPETACFRGLRKPMQLGLDAAGK